MNVNSTIMMISFCVGVVVSYFTCGLDIYYLGLITCLISFLLGITIMLMIDENYHPKEADNFICIFCGALEFIMGYASFIVLGLAVTTGLWYIYIVAVLCGFMSGANAIIWVEIIFREE